MAPLNKDAIDIDWSLLEALSDGDEDFQWELLQLYLSDTRKHLPELEAAIAQHNAEALRVEAHYLKGASGNMGVFSLHQLADELEICGRNGDLEAAPAFLDAFRSTLLQLQAQIDVP